MFEAKDFNLCGYKADPKVDSQSRGNKIHKPDWTFEDKLCSTFTKNTGGNIDLRPYASDITNQRTTGTCVAQSCINALELQANVAGHSIPDLSVLYLYYTSRRRMNPPRHQYDQGTHIWLAVNSLREVGVVPESQWKFDLSKINEDPGFVLFREASAHKISAGFRISSTGEDRVNNVIRSLQEGKPVVFGTDVDESWFRYKRQKVLTLVSNPEGSHATTLVGWTGTVFIGKNSWGRHWGDEGYYYMSPEVIADSSSSDFWLFFGGWETFTNSGE